MLKHTFRSRLARTVLALAMAGAGLANAATIHVTINTATFGAPSGYIDMQLSASAGVPLATVLVHNLSGFNPSAYIEQWGVTPAGGGYLFRNDTANDLFHAVDFGAPLSFDLTFDGAPDPLAGYVSRFVVSAFDENVGLLGNYNPVSGALADFSWTPGLTAAAAGTVGITLSDASAVAVGQQLPEPASWSLMGAALAGVALARRRKRLH